MATFGAGNSCSPIIAALSDSATFKPVAMPGGAQAVREPWRNLYAHLMAEMGLAAFKMNFEELDVFATISAKPLAVVDAMIKVSLNRPRRRLAAACSTQSPPLSGYASTGRPMKAKRQRGWRRSPRRETLREEGDHLAYPCRSRSLGTPACPISSRSACGTPSLAISSSKHQRPVISARFHKGLAQTIAAMALKLARRDEDDAPPRFDTVALSGGCFQNEVLFEDWS